MKEKSLNVFWSLVFIVIGLGVTKWGMDTNNLISLQGEKTALEIKVLQHELKAYEEMDKELAQ